MAQRENGGSRVDELIKMVQEKTGIDEAQARGAADAVLGFLKGRLPAPIASQIDGIISGGGSTDATGGLGDLANLGDLGNMKGG